MKYFFLPALLFLLISSSISTAAPRQSWNIVLGAKADVVEVTASKELGLLFSDVLKQKPQVVRESKTVLSGRRIVLGTVASSDLIGKALRLGALKQLDPECTTDDAFEISVEQNVIYIAGQNPRGVLYGVYYLDEHARRNGGQLPAKGWRIYQKPAYRERLCCAYNTLSHVYEREDVRYLSRCGYNQMFISCWGLPLGGWGMAAWADSGVFSSVKETENIDKIRGFLRSAREYGIEGVFYFFEPQPLMDTYGSQAVNNLGGEELLGRHKGMTTTCLSSPKVREHYRSMVKNLVRDFPEVGKMVVYENDGSFWLCDANECERCAKTLKKIKPPYPADNWELTTNFINLLQEAAHEVRKDFKVVGASFHYINVMDEYLDNLGPGTGVLAVNHNSDGWVYISVTPEMQERLRKVTEKTREHGIPCGIIDEFTHSEKFGFAPGCPWPYSTWQKLNAYASVGFTGFSDLAPIPNVQSVNPIILKECIWNPGQDPEKLLARVALEQFGEKAGPLMHEAWREMRRTFETYAKPGTSFWSTYLMTGNLYTQFGMFRPLTIEGLRNHPDQYYSGSPDPNSYAHFGMRLRDAEALAQIEEACTHIRRATALAAEAVNLAPADRHPLYSHFYYPGRKITCREYAEEQYHSLNFNRYIFEDNLLILKAELLVREGKDDEALKVIAQERRLTEYILRSSAAHMSRKLGRLHDAAARLTPYEVMGDRHPVVRKLHQKLSPGADAQELKRKVRCPLVTPGPSIEGSLLDPAWREAGVADEFYTNISRNVAEVQTRVLACRDAENLYLAFECEEPRMRELKAKTREPDGPVYDDDCINIFLSPVAGTYYHLICNAVGSRYDELGDDMSWNGKWSVWISRKPKKWIVEMKIPFSTLGVTPSEGDVWRCNFNRQRQIGDRAQSSWSPTKAVFNEQESFGEMVF